MTLVRLIQLQIADCRLQMGAPEQQKGIAAKNLQFEIYNLK